MKVSRLIEMLQGCPPDATVEVFSSLGDDRYREAFKIMYSPGRVQIDCNDDEVIEEETT